MSDIFATAAAAYDAWYDTPAGTANFAAEVEALRPLLGDLPQPWLEVGVGSGRFAAALGIPFGVDPALAALQLARQRDVHVVAARGEHLPFAAQIFGAVVLVVTLCFVTDPSAVLREARRVMRPDGGIVLAVVPRDSPLGAHYQLLGARGHPFYRTARFFDRAEVQALLAEQGLAVQRTRATLLDGKDAAARYAVLEGDDPRAGFVALCGGCTGAETATRH